LALRTLIELRAKLPCGMECAGERGLVGFGQPDVGHASAPPATVHGQKHIRAIAYELRLLLWCKFDVAETEFLGSERGKDAAAQAKVRGAHMRALFRAGLQKGNAAKVVGIHRYGQTIRLRRGGLQADLHGRPTGSGSRRAILGKAVRNFTRRLKHNAAWKLPAHSENTLMAASKGAVLLLLGTLIAAATLGLTLSTTNAIYCDRLAPLGVLAALAATLIALCFRALSRTRERRLPAIALLLAAVSLFASARFLARYHQACGQLEQQLRRARSER
jgi:hypothetical protein